MANQNQFFDEPSLDGPDYVALVIEWDEIADNLEREITQPNVQIERPVTLRSRLVRMIAPALGAVGVLGLAAWGIHRLRAA